MKSSEAAQVLGLSVSTIGRMIRRGELTSRPDPRDKRVQLVDREQVERLLAEIREVYGDSEDSAD